MKSYLHGRKTAPGPSLGGIPTPRSNTPFSSVVKSAKTSPAAAIEAVREGDKITKLVITCSCGEKIEIECLYATGS